MGLFYTYMEKGGCLKIETYSVQIKREFSLTVMKRNNAVRGNNNFTFFAPGGMQHKSIAGSL